MLCSVIKHSRKWREHSRSGEKHSPAARVHPTLLSCSRHFLACFITEQSTVLAFLFVKSRASTATPGDAYWLQCYRVLVTSASCAHTIKSSPQKDWNVSSGLTPPALDTRLDRWTNNLSCARVILVELQVFLPVDRLTFFVQSSL